MTRKTDTYKSTSLLMKYTPCRWGMDTLKADPCILWTWQPMREPTLAKGSPSPCFSHAIHCTQFFLVHDMFACLGCMWSVSRDGWPDPSSRVMDIFAPYWQGKAATLHWGLVTSLDQSPTPCTDLVFYYLWASFPKIERPAMLLYYLKYASPSSCSLNSINSILI